MAQRDRRSFLAGLLGAGAAAIAGPAAAAPADGLLTPAQYYGPYGYRGPRRRRCWIEQRRVFFRDRFGRPRLRIVAQRVCR